MFKLFKNEKRVIYRCSYSKLTRFFIYSLVLHLYFFLSLLNFINGPYKFVT